MHLSDRIRSAHDHPVVRGLEAVLLIAAVLMMLLGAGFWISGEYWHLWTQLREPWLVPYVIGMATVVLVWNLEEILIKREIGREMMWRIEYMQAWFETLSYPKEGQDE